MKQDEYQSVAGFYDRLFTPFLKKLRQDIRTYVFHKGYKKVIDICCGTGEQLRLLDHPDRTLHGIDISVSMLEQAKKVCPEHIELQLLDAEQETFAAGSFDCAIISFSLHEKHQAARQVIFNNSRKLIRQGGSIIIADYGVVPQTIPGFFMGKIIIPLTENSLTHWL